MQRITAEELLKKVQNDYNQIAQEFDCTRQHAWKEFDLYLEYINEGDKVADIGCGNGRLLEFLKNNLEIEYCGIDNSKELLEIARKAHPKAQFKYGELQKIPLEDNQYDVTCCIAALHHLPNKDLRPEGLRELKRITKKNGYLIISVWNLFQAKYKKYIWKARLNYLLSFGRYHYHDTFIPWSESNILRYYYAYTEKELLKNLEAIGLKVLKTEKHNNLLAICQVK